MQAGRLKLSRHLKVHDFLKVPWLWWVIFQESGQVEREWVVCNPKYMCTLGV